MCGALTEAPLGTLALSSPGNYLRPLEMVIQRHRRLAIGLPHCTRDGPRLKYPRDGGLHCQLGVE